MKWLPGSSCFVGAFCFFIAAAFADAAGAFIVIGCALAVVGIALSRRAQTTPDLASPETGWEMIALAIPQPSARCARRRQLRPRPRRFSRCLTRRAPQAWEHRT